jgi:hypothetical protein
VERYNSEGIPRDKLVVALRDRRLVAEARRVGFCILCRRSPVNEAGLCEICYSGLDGEELRLATTWTSGAGP